MPEFKIEVMYVDATTYIGEIEVEAFDEEAAILAARRAHNADEITFSPSDDIVGIEGPHFSVTEWEP